MQPDQQQGTPQQPVNSQIYQPQLPPNGPIKPPSTRRKLPYIIITIVLISLLTVSGVLFVFSKTRSKQTKYDATITGTQKTTDEVQIDTSSLESAYDSFYKNGVTDFSPNKKSQTIAALAELSAGFLLSSDFYQDEPNLLISLGIGYLYANDKSNKLGYRNELYLLASPYLSELPSGISDPYFIKPSDQANSAAVIGKYTDTKLSAEIDTIIKSSDVYDEVRSSLKVSGSLSPYTAIVVDFNNGTQRQKDFAKEHYMFGASPKMWVETIADKTYIVFVKEYAENFIKNPQGSERSSIIHEFIHAQSHFNRGDLGRAIEERRAEKFSGDKSSYFDAKQFFIYQEVLSGISPIDMLAKNPTEPSKFYLDLYAKFGTKVANQFICSWPSVYLTQASPAVKQVMELTGGMEGASNSALEIGKKDPAALNKRLQERGERLYSVFKTKDKVLQDLDNNLANAYGMPSAAKVMKEYVQSH